MPYVTLDETFSVSGIAVFSGGDFVTVLQDDAAVGLKILLESSNPIETSTAQLSNYKILTDSVNFSDSLEVYAEPGAVTGINIHFDYISHTETDKAELEQSVCSYVLEALGALSEHETLRDIFVVSPLYKVSAIGNRISH